ncbi:MAG: hypothetical protein U1F53_13520 [Burkholderiaceae bacterium]
MPTLSTGAGTGFRAGVSRLLAGLGRAARVLFGLVLLSTAFVMGLLLAAALVLRALLRRGPPPARPASRRPTGEVVDVEAREVGPGRQ